jgi:TonB family protein
MLISTGSARARQCLANRVSIIKMAGFHVHKNNPYFARMNRIILVCLVLLVYMASSAQTTNPVDAPSAPVQKNTDSVTIFTKVELESEFRGGAKAWQNYLSANIQYPKAAIKKNIQGTVIVQFIVTKEGKVQDVIIDKSVHPSLDKEAIRLIKNSPNWIPAQQDGKKVNSYKKQPIVFMLAG